MAWMRSGLTLSMNVRNFCDARRTVRGPNHCLITVRRPKVRAEALPGSLRRLLKPAKSNRSNFESINLEIQRAGKSGCNVYLIAAFGKVTDPIDCNRGAAIHYEEVAHKDGLYVIACEG